MILNFATANVYLNIVLFVIGIFLLIKGSDFFIDSASALAKKLGVSDIIIGLTLVSLGTSMPELSANVCAALNKQSNIALGNVVGSNFTNVALVLGISCILVRKIDVPKNMYSRDVLIMVASSLTLSIILLFFGVLNLTCGIIFLIATIAYTILLLKQDAEDVKNDSKNSSKKIKLASILIFFPLGLMMIFCGSKFVVDNTIWICQTLKLSQSVIASTVVALGTSLPELAVTISGIIKKENGIALGNIVGSNIFNILLILGVSSVITPLIADKTMIINIAFLLVSDILLLIFFVTQKRLFRYHGLIFLLIYLSFLIFNIYSLKAMI